MQKCRVNLIKTALLILMVALPVFTVRAQNFSAPKNISNSAGSSSTESRVAVDSRGNIYVVWNDGNSGALEIFFSRSTDGGATFSAPQNLSSNSGDSFSPEIALDSGGNINVVWTDNTPGNDDILFSRSTNGGVTFSAPKDLSNNGGNSFNSEIGVDSSGNINVVWEDASPGNLDILFSHSTNGGATFSAPQNLSNSIGNSEIPQIAVDNSGNVNVAWQDDRSGHFDVFFTRSSNGGASFSIPQDLSNNSGESIFVQIGLDSAGNINMVWQDTTSTNFGILYTRSTDGGATFTLPQNLSNDSGTSQQFPQIAVDSGGKINVVWEDNTLGKYDIFFTRSTDGGASFSPPKNLSSSGGASLFPQIGLDSAGNINMIWEDDTSGNYDIFFSRSINDGASFSTPQNLSNSPGLSEFQQIAVDKVGNVNVVWSDFTPGNSDVFFSQFVVDDDSVFSQLNGGNTFTGNQTVNGSVTATSFAGNGAGLTGVAALTANTATFANTANFANTAGMATSAGTATNALSLGGVVASNYARLDIGNNFSGNQAVTGNLSASGSATLSGPVTIGGGTPIIEHLSQTATITVPPIAPNNCATLPTVTFSGASDGDTIALGVKNALTSGGNLTYFAWVSASNSITIKVCNPHGTSNSSLSGVIRVDIWKH